MFIENSVSVAKMLFNFIFFIIILFAIFFKQNQDKRLSDALDPGSI
jgi:hypothetical protein